RLDAHFQREKNAAAGGFKESAKRRRSDPLYFRRHGHCRLFTPKYGDECRAIPTEEQIVSPEQARSNVLAAKEQNLVADGRPEAEIRELHAMNTKDRGVELRRSR